LKPLYEKRIVLQLLSVDLLQHCYVVTNRRMVTRREPLVFDSIHSQQRKEE
jgi:hypothetical protein